MRGSIFVYKSSAGVTYAHAKQVKTMQRMLELQDFVCVGIGAINTTQGEKLTSIYVVFDLLGP